MKKQDFLETSDSFLYAIKHILQLPNDYRFDKAHMNMFRNLKVSKEQERQLKRLIRDTNIERADYNFSDSHHIRKVEPDWCKNVLKRYFDIVL